ncbi:hypothetical protein LCGC14_3165740 [marine sediment metagenome]|uniref:Uncharacterized protein n=1 Tax=marine sediment metagenome TaxID=412755 RepID=A0A0F8VLU2_9ZZZZ
MRTRTGWGALAIFAVLLLFIGVSTSDAAPTDVVGVVESAWPTPTVSLLPVVVAQQPVVLIYEVINTHNIALDSTPETITVLISAESAALLDIAMRVNAAPRIPAMVNTGKRTTPIDRLYRGASGRFRTGI